MRIRSAMAVLLLGTAVAAAQSRAPQRPANGPDLPPVRVELQDAAPPVEPMQTETVLRPSACRLRLSAELAQAPSIPPRAGPGACGGEDLVRLEAIHLPDQSKVVVSPPAVLRCSMAEALVDWARSEIPPANEALGARVTGIDNFAAYDCRGRNNVAGAKLSEHGQANAFDLRGFKLATGKAVDLTDAATDRDLRDRLRGSLCDRFTTVLGPGSDRYHENHIHLDIIQRRGGYRMCQWTVREPVQVAAVPLPPERPKDLTEATGGVAPAAAVGAAAGVPLPTPRPTELAGLSRDRGAPAEDKSESTSRRDGKAPTVTTEKGDGTAGAAPSMASKRAGRAARRARSGWFPLPPFLGRGAQHDGDRGRRRRSGG